MSFTQQEIKELVNRQREYFGTGETLKVDFRIAMLKKLKDGLQAWAPRFEEALGKDLGRTPVEGYLCDVGPLLIEINETIRGLRRWARPETHLSGLMNFPSVLTRVYPMPYGVTLIISPFNFPFMLTIGPLISSIAGGNTAVLKTSSKSVACTETLKAFIQELFPSEYVAVVDGGHDVADLCLAERFDKIFYTGSPSVAKHVMAEAAKNLTPVALELGGETGNWCVVRKGADLKDAARKIAFFKIMNAGQICININQVAVAREVAGALVEELRKAFTAFLGDKPLENPEYPKLINAAAYEKCRGIAEAYRDRIVFGGEGNADSLRYAPTLIYPVDIQEEIVQKELFCPLLPIVPFEEEGIDGLMKTISEREHPLALYLFTKNMRWAKRIMSSMQYGGGCVNEVCVHILVKGVPFNGTGHSGLGAYHGIWGFREFTHPSTVLFGKNRMNLPVREHPYTGKAGELKRFLIKLLER